jgi:glycosyltransferase involved in cell wall biosynthesis
VILSIGIPTFNRGHFLESCLNSIASQVYEFSKEVELIVSDNYSTDNNFEATRRIKKLDQITLRKQIS